ncbi:MAG TPA: hypothetical protein VJ866_12995 [Pyrinomonadaceae bacterium]|nr:hypothetical protein [Pyrinomonadaceae bacterium]
MSFDTSRVRAHLDDFNFRELFIEELGWSRPTERQKVSFEVGSEGFERRAIAELDGMIAHLYKLTEDEFAYVLSTFPSVADEVKEAALEQFRRLVPLPDDDTTASANSPRRRPSPTRDSAGAKHPR